MVDGFIQLPADSTGKQLDTVTVNMGVGTTSVHREKIVVADPASTSAFAVVTSSQGLQVSSTQAQTISGTVTILSASSGLVQISGTPTVTATAGTNPWSSAPGFNVPVVSVSSGLVQISGIPAITSTSVLLTTGSIISLSSGTVSMSSQITVTATGPVTITSGTVTLSSVHTMFSASSGGVQAFIPISPTSSVAGAGFGPVTSSAGVLATISSGTVSLSSQITVTATGPVTITSGTVTLSSNPTVISASSGLVQVSGTVTVLSASSGLVQISGIPTVGIGSTGAITSTSVVLSSAGLTQISGTVTVLSASSGLVQASQVGTWTMQTTAGTAINTSSALGFPIFHAITPTSSIAGASLSPVTSSAGLLASLSSGFVSVTSGTITSTSATNPWSSAPGFNVPIVSVSSGLIQISGTPTVTATAGTNPWSSAPGFNVPVVTVSSGLAQMFVQGSTGTLAIVTSSGALLVSGTPGSVSTAVNIIGGTTGIFAPVTSSFGLLTQSTQPTSLTSGTVTLSSQHTVTNISASSGLVQISGIPTVTATAATNPWSSAPGFNVPVVSVSSGFIRAFPVGAVTSSGLSVFHRMTTGGAAVTVITTAPSSLYGYAIFNSSAVPRTTKFYNSTAPTIGGTANLLLSVQAPGSTGGGGANLTLPMGLYSSNGWSCIITAGMGDTDTGAPGTNDISCGVFYQT